MITFMFLLQLLLTEKLATIKSIELQLVRVETCGCAEGYARECNYHGEYLLDNN